MRFRVIEEHITSFPIKRLCSVVGVSPRGLRAFRSRPASRRQRSDLVTLAHIKEQSRFSLGSYGRPRMFEELKEIGLDVRHRRVGRLMRQNGISVIRTRRHKVTTDSDHKFNIAPNLLGRDFAADAPNQKWVGNLSYAWTREGWLYLAVILDLHSRRIIGWAVSNRIKRDLAIRALNMAIAFRASPEGCIHHTDRVWQYCSHDYQKILRQHGFKVAMSGKGNYYDNSAVETFFKTIKAELIWRRSWDTQRQAEMAIFEYINGFDNPRRRHSDLAGKAWSLSNGRSLKRALGAALKRDRSTGKIRLTFFSQHHQVQITADDRGKVLTCDKARIGPSSPAQDEWRAMEALLDEALAESFPASDPIAVSFDVPRRARDESGKSREG